MTINETIIKEVESAHRKHLPEELKNYLLVKYAEEPFPYEYSEQDLYTNIHHDIDSYDTGELDVSAKSPSERWQEEREYLQAIYIDKASEVRELLEHVAKLERMLSKHGLDVTNRKKSNDF